jgi:hypothetical protein
VLGERVQDEGAEAADRALLDGDQGFVLAGQAQDQVDVERLGEAGVATVAEMPRAASGRRPSATSPARAEGEDGDGRAFAHDAALADLEGAARPGSDAGPSPRG